MTNKPLSKLLSATLAIAICVTTVFGCLVTANALDIPSYVITGANCTKGQTTASATVEFTATEGIAGGNFIIDNEGGWYSSVEASFSGMPNAETDQIIVDTNMRDSKATVLFYITDEDGSAKNYTAVTLKLDFVIANGGITDDIEITLSDLEITDRFEDPYANVTNNSTNQYFTAGCRHKYIVNGTKVYDSKELEYTVYSDAVCEVCGEAKDGYQVVPGAEDDGTVVEKWDQYSDGAWSDWYDASFDGKGDGTKDNPYIITSAEELANLCRYGSNAGVYYKVDDNIKAFDMNNSGIDLSSDDVTAEYVKQQLADVICGKVWACDAPFKGNFDGNGVEIYGLRAGPAYYNQASFESGSKAGYQYGGLFGQVDASTASIKNVKIKNSYFIGESAGAIFGYTAYTNGSVKIENCAVVNCYIESTSNSGNDAGVIGGKCQYDGTANISDKVLINNCIVYGNTIVNKSGSKRLVGTMDAWHYNGSAKVQSAEHFSIKNTIAIGCAIENPNSFWQKNSSLFVNCYTTEAHAAENTTITTLASAEDAKGSAAKTNMPDLDWNTDTNPDGVWFTGNGEQYPTLLKKAALDVADSTNYEWKLLGVNIEYQNDGGFALNFHFEPSYDTDISLYLANANDEYKSQILTEYTTSSFAGTTLSADAKMFTVSNLSAKDMDILWLPTLVATSKAGDSIVYSETKQISITDYANAVVSGECFYDEDATEAEKSADKTVAAALINYSNASANALAITTPSTTSKVVEKWDNISDGVRVDWYDASFDGKGDGTKDNPYIITSAEELANLCRYGSEANVYYKVDDSIKAFDMNSNGIDFSSDDITTEYIKEQLADIICGKVWACDAAFKGNFDGNGVEIYGLRAGPAYYNQASFESGSKAGYQYGGLFGRIDTSTATIKNVKIKNSYFIGESAGAIFGYTEYTNGSVKIENCSVVNCYIESTSNSGNDAGAIGGMCRFNGTENISDKVLINNCIVYGNAIVNNTGNKNLIGVIDAWHYNGSTKVQSPEHYSIKNTIAIGCNIAKNNYWTNADALYLNCYTTETTGTTATTVNKLSSADDAKGAAAMSNMSALDWDNVWLFGDEGEYPTIAPRVDNENAKGTTSIRSQTNESQPFVLKDPSKANSESNPYLVETAAQMYMLMRGVAKDSNGTNISTTGNSNYFKVADGIDAFYMTSIDIGELNSAADVKAWFENSANTDFKKVWSGTPFSGHFDGNGVEIYGVRSDDSVAALFPIVAGTTTIKNVTVKNSYLKGSAGAAGIVCKTTNGNDSTVTIENCKLINCYVEAGKNGANAGAASVVGFSYGSPIIVNDVIIYGNQFVSPSGHSYGLVSYGWSSASKFTNIISIGHEPYRVTDLTTGANASYHYTKNEAFSGVYTDKIAQGAYYDASGDKTIHYFNYNESQVKQLAVSEMMGPGAVQNMPHLSWAENGGDWYAGALGDYPSFEPAGMLPSNLQAQYDSISFGEYDNYENSTNTFGVYTTALSLKANPYISFAFAFHGDYKVNRDKIKIRFTYTENGAKVTSSEVSVPAYNGEDIVNVNGWTNTAKNGRYHTYKAENIPVEALANGIKVEANYNNTGWIDFGTYSAEGLGIQFERLNRNNPCDYYETRVEAVKALLFYVQAIQSRYGAQ